MTSTFWKSGAALAAILTIAACSGSPMSPTAPSATTGGSTAAAADGSTLKVTAPSLVSPIGGARITTRKPQLQWTDVSGTYASAAPVYEVEVTAEGAVVYTAMVTGTAHDVTSDAAYNTTYTWRVRARQDGAAGPWSASGSFVSPNQPPVNTGGLITEGFRTPDPGPGGRLPLPYEFGTVADEANRNPGDWANSCQSSQGNRGWVWLDKLVDRLRTKDLRWGYNGKRGNPNDPSGDVIDYHYGAGDSQFSTQVYILDVMVGHCGGSPGPAWIDVTAVTVNSGTVGMFIYPRPGRPVTTAAVNP
jgi:hypothetical protein